MGSSDESKLRRPNQLFGVRFAPKKYTSQKAQRRTPKMDEFVGILVCLLISEYTFGAGP